MGKKNTGSNSRSKNGKRNNGILHPGNRGDSAQLFQMVQRHGAPSLKIHWAYYTGAFFGLQAFFDSFCQKITDSFIQNVDFTVAPQLFSNSHRLYR